jgi:hypothetical protein
MKNKTMLRSRFQGKNYLATLLSGVDCLETGSCDHERIQCFLVQRKVFRVFLVGLQELMAIEKVENSKNAHKK